MTDLTKAKLKIVATYIRDVVLGSLALVYIAFAMHVMTYTY